MKEKNILGGGLESKDLGHKKRKIVKISVLITSIFVIFLSITYAFINQTLTGTKRQVITAGNLSLELLEDDNNLAITNALPMYDEVGMLQDPFTFRLINNTAVDTDYILKLDEIQVDASLGKENVKYGLTKDGEVTIDLVSTIIDGVVDEGTISGNQTIEYSLRLWVKDSVTDTTAIKNKALRYRVGVKAEQNTEIPETGVPIVEKLFANENIGTNCKTYNDGVDTFLVGRCSQNYVWYSGKLWRVVLKNNTTGAVKMMTDDQLTVISYNSENNTAFANSYVDQWLNQEFLPTLHDYGEYLDTNSSWYTQADAVYGKAHSRPKQGIVNRAVGLLNLYEYYTASENNSASNYLNNNTYWWTITPEDSTTVRNINNNGEMVGIRIGSKPAIGVRPAINLKQEIEIVAGEGTISNPYKLAKEEKVKNGRTRLSTRYSGEYLNFNGEKYRIVQAENRLTKIVAVEKPSALMNSSIPYKSSPNFLELPIAEDLNNYYMNSIDATSKKMIEQDTTWYIGGINNYYLPNYKITICASVDINTSTIDCEKISEQINLNIGFLRYGEIFASLNNYKKEVFWVLTPDNSKDWRYASMVDNLGQTNGKSSHDYGIRPSMYLKSNVVIASDNTGDGTYEHPYSIELKES